MLYINEISLGSLDERAHLIEVWVRLKELVLKRLKTMLYFVDSVFNYLNSFV